MITLRRVIVFLYIVSIGLCTSLDYESLYYQVVENTWASFWNPGENSWSSKNNCLNDFKYPSVWDQAVAGKIITESRNEDRIKLVIDNINDYRNIVGWYSSSTAKDDDIYVDDNAQLLWVLLDSYEFTGNVNDLNLAIHLMNLIQTQGVDNGGVRWKLNDDYIASISTSELALAAIKLYQVNGDEGLLQFSIDSINWLFNNLQDPDDKLIYDGKSATTGEINKGKLSYSVGTMISTLAYLAQSTQESYWFFKALELVQAALNKNGVFYADKKVWNNSLRYSHLLFMGIKDLITIYTKGSNIKRNLYKNLQKELDTQASFIYNTLRISPGVFADNVDKAKSMNKDISCYGNPAGKIMDNASAAQIFFAMSQIHKELD